MSDETPNPDVPIGVKITRESDAATTELRGGRGTKIKLVGPEDGAANIDFHINVLNTDSGLGPYHLHRRAENIYLVLEGTVAAVIDGVRHELKAGDVAFIPPGVPHAAGSDGSGPARVLEVYAPAGDDFHILDVGPIVFSQDERRT